MTPNDPTKVNADSLDGGESIQTTLGELWELLGKGRHKAWPECIELFDEPGYRRCWLYLGNEPVAVSDEEHALAIVRDHIEGWLVEMGWVITIAKGQRVYVGVDVQGFTIPFDTLTDAVRYALAGK